MLHITQNLVEMSGDKAWNCYMDFIDFGDDDFNKF